MSDYKILFGVEHLKEISTSVSLAFDTETLQLQPECGKLRLLQLGSGVRNSVVLIDFFDFRPAHLFFCLFFCCYHTLINSTAHNGHSLILAQISTFSTFFFLVNTDFITLKSAFRVPDELNF